MLEELIEVRPQMFDGVTRMGMTAAASTPERLVQGIVEQICGLYPGTMIIEQKGPIETRVFKARR